MKKVNSIHKFQTVRVSACKQSIVVLHFSHTHTHKKKELKNTKIDTKRLSNNKKLSIHFTTLILFK